MEIGSHKIRVSRISLIIAATLLSFGVVFFMTSRGVVFFMTSRLSEDKALALYSQYVEQGKRSEAIEVLKNALLSNPDSELLLLRLGLEYTNMAVELTGLREDKSQSNRIESLNKELRKGIHFYSRLISWRPENVRLYKDRASLYFALGDYDAVIRDYTKAIELLDQEPDSPQKDGYLLDAYFCRYVSHKEKMDWHGAATDLEKVIDLAKKWAPTFKCGEDEHGPHCYVLLLVREQIPQELKRVRQFASLGSEWVYYGYSENAYLFYNRSRITTLPEGRVRVWIRYEPEDDYIRQWLAQRFRFPRGFKYSHQLSCFEVDCENWTYRVLGRYAYDTGGIIISSDSHPDPEPTLVPPDGSVWDNLLKAVCRDKK